MPIEGSKQPPSTLTFSSGKRGEDFILPVTATSLWGGIYAPGEDVWPGTSSSRYCDLHFETLRPYVTDSLLNSIKLAMVELNRIRKSASVYNYLHQAKLFLEHSAENFTLVDSISRTMLENYWITLPVQQKPGMSQLRRLLQAVMIYGDPLHGIESDALNYLNRLPIPLTKASDAVSTWDPHHGPFTDIEDQCLLNALHAAFELGELGLEDYVLLLLFRFSGMRRSQLADLKVGDLKKVIHEDGKIQYTILIPRAKEKGAAWRSNLTPRALAPNIAALIEGFVEIQKEKWKHLNCPADMLPMFPQANPKDQVRLFHRTGEWFGDSATRIGKTLKVISRRTGVQLHIHSKRFRITLATWAFRAGASIYEVAELLDLRSTDSLKSYMATDPEVLEEINRKMSLVERPLANAFLGKLERCPVDPHQAIYAPLFLSRNPVGGCATKCERPKPFACYVCSQFQALMDGPHEDVLSEVVRLRDEIITSTGNPTLAGVLQDVIDAVRNVIIMRDDRERKEPGQLKSSEL